ncbi:MAG TPA: type II restriction endonuclease, partial [Chitinophagaceae bacterium]|nr:type II restriction endonuclease [Chitinophagaceae bacterium]
FKTIENDRYSTRIKTPFISVEELVETANTILNRRKSRAGKSLEHHLSEIFQTFSLSFATQAVTEDNKKPDFLFPSKEAYHNPKFDENKLILLASKTTCKDRWRQVLNEADRIKVKHLFTLQQGISKNQLDEMYKYNVRLVVPKPYVTSFPPEFRDKILTLDTFVNQVQTVQQS